MFAIKKYGDASPMNHSNALVIARHEVGISKHVHITHLNEPSIFECENGSLGMVLKIEGVTFDSERDEVLNHYNFALHRALSMLDDRFAVYVTLHRHRDQVSLTGTFDNVFSQQLNDQYHQQFQNTPMYVN